MSSGSQTKGFQRAKLSVFVALTLKQSAVAAWPRTAEAPLEKCYLSFLGYKGQSGVVLPYLKVAELGTRRVR